MEYTKREPGFQAYALDGVEGLVAAAKHAVAQHNPRQANDALCHLDYLTMAMVQILKEATPEDVGNDERERRLEAAMQTLRGFGSSYFKRY